MTWFVQGWPCGSVPKSIVVEVLMLFLSWGQKWSEFNTLLDCSATGCRLSSTSSRRLSVSAERHLAAMWKNCLTYASLALKHPWYRLPLKAAFACCDLSSRNLWLKSGLVHLLAADLWWAWPSQSLQILQLERMHFVTAAPWGVWPSRNLWLKSGMVRSMAAARWWPSQSLQICNIIYNINIILIINWRCFSWLQLFNRFSLTRVCDSNWEFVIA